MVDRGGSDYAMSDIQGHLGFYQRRRAFVAPHHDGRVMVVPLMALDLRPMLPGDDHLGACFSMPRSYGIHYVPREQVLINRAKPAVLRYRRDGSQNMLLQVSDYISLLHAQGYSVSEY